MRSTEFAFEVRDLPFQLVNFFGDGKLCVWINSTPQLTFHEVELSDQQIQLALETFDFFRTVPHAGLLVFVWCRFGKPPEGSFTFQM
jgi:hypothetical protein